MSTMLDLTGSASLSWQNEQGYFVMLKEPTAFFIFNYSLTPCIHAITCPACFYKSLFSSLWHKVVVDHAPVYGKKVIILILHLCSRNVQVFMVILFATLYSLTVRSRIVLKQPRLSCSNSGIESVHWCENWKKAFSN